MSNIDRLSPNVGLTCSGKKYVDLYVTEHCPTYITFADLGILSQFLVSGFGLSGKRCLRARPSSAQDDSNVQSVGVENTQSSSLRTAE